MQIPEAETTGICGQAGLLQKKAATTQGSSRGTDQCEVKLEQMDSVAPVEVTQERESNSLLTLPQESILVVCSNITVEKVTRACMHRVA